jgi:hypothetical protein
LSILAMCESWGLNVWLGIVALWRNSGDVATGLPIQEDPISMP